MRAGLAGLDAVGGPVAYRYEGLVARARRDPVTGRVECAVVGKTAEADPRRAMIWAPGGGVDG